jgi:acyl carrier protein
VDDRAAALAVIRRVVNGELGLSCAVRPEDDLVLDLHLDSVGLLTLVVELEDAFRVALREEDAAAVRTVADLCALVAQRSSSPESPSAPDGSSAPAGEPP